MLAVQNIVDHISSNLDPDDVLLLAVSGGLDSVFLSYIFNLVNRKVIIAHFNHNTRPDSVLDQKLTEEISQKYSVPFYTTTWKKSSATRSEDAMRRARYSWLEKVRKKVGARYIVTAHHADDQAETILMNLMRGSGIAGLRGMKEFKGFIYRPLLRIPKSDIIEAVKKLRLAYRDDPTNQDQRFRRNFIRMQILPLITGKNPNFLQTIAHTSQRLQEIEHFLESEVQQWIKKEVKSNAFKKAHFRNLPVFFQAELLRILIPEAQGFTFEHIQEFTRILNSVSSGKKAIIKGYEFKIGREYIHFSKI